MMIELENVEDMYQLRVIAVDILPFNIQLLINEISNEEKDHNPAIVEERYAPELVETDVLNYSLEGGADVITAVEGIYYCDDPILVLDQMITNLSDGGLLILNGLSEIYINISDYRRMTLDRFLKLVVDFVGLKLLSSDGDGAIIEKEPRSDAPKIRDFLGRDVSDSAVVSKEYRLTTSAANLLGLK